MGEYEKTYLYLPAERETLMFAPTRSGLIDSIFKSLTRDLRSLTLETERILDQENLELKQTADKNNIVTLTVQILISVLSAF